MPAAPTRLNKVVKNIRVVMVAIFAYMLIALTYNVITINIRNPACRYYVTIYSSDAFYLLHFPYFDTLCGLVLGQVHW